ncbi:MAG: tRNA lysidine(34) synthetase TilS [Planctomycetes bacterium]|nr:tRNA lysidine(34) synthetase TilS [Planctomycetota bacterium]
MSFTEHSHLHATPSSGAFSPARWGALARAVAVDPEAPIVVALSGGADSVYLLHVLAAAVPAVRLLAVHVAHGLRGEESERDARFAADLCTALNVPFKRVEAPLYPSATGLEARAREVRYAALCRAAREADIGVIATGHHADDALETLIMRMIRGTALEGLAGLEKKVALTRPMNNARGCAHERIEDGGTPLVLVRPLIALRREEVRRTLSAEGLAWIEDGSNASDRFARNRVRHALLPRLDEIAGPAALENLRAFGSAVEEFEEHCAALTTDIHWSPPVHAAARRGIHETDLGGSIQRALLMRLARPLLKRALWRLVTEGVGSAPSRRVLERIVDDLASGRTAIHGLPAGFSLQLRSDLVLLEPPATVPAARSHDSAQLDLFETHTSASAQPLSVPGRARLADGRVIEARVLEVKSTATVSRSELDGELDLELLDGPLSVRFARPGDRFRGLGAPGARSLARFLADAGVPRNGRGRVPLVCAGDEIVWVAGVRPCERARVSERTTRRLVLRLVHKDAERPTRRRTSSAPVLPFDSR